MRPVGKRTTAPSPVAFCGGNTTRCVLVVAMLLGCRKVAPLHGELVALTPSHLRNASEFSCIGVQDACWRNSADTTEFFYADSTGLVTTVGMQIRVSASDGENLFRTMATTLTAKYGNSFTCDEPLPSDGDTRSARWRAGSGIVLVLSVAEPGPSNEFPGIVQLTFTTQSRECGSVPSVPLPG